MDALLHELHTNSYLLLKNPDASKEPSFSSWQNEFSADNYTGDIASLLDRYPELRSKMDGLVPETVSYKDFWMRYLYQKSKIDAYEAKRKHLLENNEEENEFDWDGDDEADDVEYNNDQPFLASFSREGKTSTETVKLKSSSTPQQSEPAPRNSSTSESSTSFDIVSQSSAIPPLTMDKVIFTPSFINFRSLKKKVMMTGSSLDGILGVRVFVNGCVCDMRVDQFVKAFVAWNLDKLQS